MTDRPTRGRAKWARELRPLGELVLDDAAVWGSLEASPDGMAVCDTDGRIVYANLQLEALTGFDRADLLGQPIEILVPDPSRGRHRALRLGYRAAPRNRMMGEGTPLEVRRADGRTVPVEISLAPVELAGVWMTAASVRDVSLQRADDRGRRRLLELLDLVPDPVFLMDATTLQIEYANHGAATLLGYSQDELVTMTAFHLGPHLTESTSRQLVDDLAAAGVERRRVNEIVLRTRDGVDVTCELHVRLLEDQGADSRRLVAVARDVRERHAAEQLKARQGELTAVIGSVTNGLLAGASPHDTYRDVAEGMARMFGTDNAAVLLPDPATGVLRLTAATGNAFCVQGAEALTSLQLAVAGGLAAGEAVAFTDQAEPVHRTRALLGPAAIARFGESRAGRGVLAVVRGRGAEPFASSDLDLLAALGHQLALAVELGRARDDQQRLALLEERQRIARDLHDTVIQELIAIGMLLNRRPRDLPAPASRELDSHLIDQLEDAVRHLRGSVFQLRHQPASQTVTQTIQATLAEAARTLGFRPTLVIEGAVDQLPAAVVEHLIPTLREALSNIARHADATASDIMLTRDGDAATLTVDDNGHGLPDGVMSGTGITNLTERAAALGGTATITRRNAGGTRLFWTSVNPTGGGL